VIICNNMDVTWMWAWQKGQYLFVGWAGWDTVAVMIPFGAVSCRYDNKDEPALLSYHQIEAR
jgi:hypothetical protein